MRKIEHKLILAAALTALVTIGVFSYFNIRLHGTSLLREVERHVSQLSDTVKDSIRYDMLLNQQDRIHKIISSIAENPSIQDVRIFNKAGEVIHSSKPEDIGNMVDQRAESCYVCHKEDEPLERLPIQARSRIFQDPKGTNRVFGIINPIYNEPSCWTASCHAHPQSQSVLGVLDVTISLRDVDHEIMTNEIEMVIFALSAVLFLSFVIGYFVKRWVDRPVREILRATDEVGMGNFDHLIPPLNRDELGLLGRSFNAMTRKLFEARLQIVQSDKLASLGRIAAGIAHEINNPLTGILTYSSFILKRCEDQSELKQDMEVIVRETLRSRDIVKSLLDFSRQSLPNKKQSHFNDIVHKALQVVESQMALKHVEIECCLDQNLPITVLDQNQMEQVLINLLVNASDAMGEQGGRVTLSTTSVHLAPAGVVSVKRAYCPHRHHLMCDEVKIHGRPSIRLLAKSGSWEGLIYLNPLYGQRHYRHGDHPERVEQLMCPTCRQSLIVTEPRCPICNNAVFAFEVPGEGTFYGCVDPQCAWEIWPEVDRKGAKTYIEVRVTDTGCGISKDNLVKIFDPFFTTKGADGTGLGLSVIWGIVDNHNGSIQVESEPGQGSTFILRLPQEGS